MATPRPRRRLVAGVAAAAALAAGAGAASAAPDVRLDFGQAVDGTIADGAGAGTGFTTVLSPKPGETGLVPANLLLTNVGVDGVLAVTTTDGDAAKPGAQGGSDQENALSVPVDVGADYAVEATLLGPLGLTEDGQSAGIYIGVDQTDYVKLVVRQASGSDGLQLRVEEDNAGGPQQTRGVTSISNGQDQTVTLRLEVDVDAGQVRALFSVNGGPLTPVSSPAGQPGVANPVAAPFVAVPGALAGIISTHPVGGTPVTVRYTSFTVDTPPAVEGVFPAAAAVDVPVDASAVVTFSDAMDPASTAAAIGLARTSDGAPVAAAVGLSADGRTATVDPVADLDASTGYTLTVGATAADATGNALPAAVQSAFTTAAAPPPPPAPPAPVPPVAQQLPAPTPPAAVRKLAGATGLRAAWNRRTGKLTLRLRGLKGATTVKIGRRAVKPRAGVVRITRRRAGAIVLRVAPKPAARGRIAARSWRVVLPPRGRAVVRPLGRR